MFFFPLMRLCRVVLLMGRGVAPSCSVGDGVCISDASLYDEAIKMMQSVKGSPWKAEEF